MPRLSALLAEIGTMVRWLAAVTSVQMRQPQSSSMPITAVSPLPWFIRMRRLAAT